LNGEKEKLNKNHWRRGKKRGKIGKKREGTRATLSQKAKRSEKRLAESLKA